MEQTKEETRYIVRIANTDLNGNKQLYHALTGIKGISYMFANAIANAAGVNKTKKVGILTENEIKRIDDAIKDPSKYKIPVWMLNRRRDIETFEDKHLIGSDLKFTVDNDIKMMKKIKTYKGVRHISGLPVRGQRTKSNFRRNKGKVLGVKRRAGAKSGKV